MNMNRRSFLKALASLAALPSLAWTGARTMLPQYEEWTAEELRTLEQLKQDYRDMLESRFMGRRIVDKSQSNLCTADEMRAATLQWYQDLVDRGVLGSFDSSKVSVYRDPQDSTRMVVNSELQLTKLNVQGELK